MLKELEEKIIREGTVLPGNVLKVGSFLNQQIDVELLMNMGKEIARLFADSPVTKILTVEASGIAFAVAVGAAMHVPVVFAKKSKSSNVTGPVYSTTVHSYTHGNDNFVTVPQAYLNASDSVLLVDDFLASGCALVGLLDLVKQAGAKAVGAAIEIEKGFQDGGDSLRASGLRVESLAIVESMEDGHIVFRSN